MSNSNYCKDKIEILNDILKESNSYNKKDLKEVLQNIIQDYQKDLQILEDYSIAESNNVSVYLADQKPTTEYLN